jgi:ABC-2 type transport system permease protein
MSKLGALVRAGLRSNFGLAIFFHRIFREKKDRWIAPLIAFSLLGVVPMLYGLVSFIEDLYFHLLPIGQQRVVLNLGLLAGQGVILIFGIYYVISAFYFSRDLDLLIPLPVRPSSVFLSKFFVLLVNEYLTVAVIVLPFVITYGILLQAGFGYWINAALVYAALPIMPLVIISLVVVPMMRLINLTRKKDILVFAGGVAVLVAAFGFQYLTQRAQQGDAGTQQIAAILSSPDGLLHRTGKVFPPSIWATRAIAEGFSGEGLANLGLFLGVSLLLLCGMALLAEKLFYRGAVGFTETSARKRTLTRNEMSRRVTSGRRAVSAIFMREFRIMNRTPVFLLNGIVIVVVLPVIIVLTSPSRADLAGFMERGNWLTIVLFLALGMVACNCINGTAASSFSREGTHFWISQVIPVAPREQVSAKFLHAYLVGMLGAIAALATLAAFFPLKPIWIVLAAGLGLLAGIPLTAVGMIIDLARPLLDWTNPQKAIKQNLNVLLAMLADLGILAAAFFFIRYLIKSRVPEALILATLLIALAGLGLLSYLALLRFAQKRYSEIGN